MKRLSATLALALLSLSAGRAMAEGAPKLDVARSCKEAGDFGGGGDAKLAFKGCMQDENDAYAQLQRDWSRYKPETRSTCIAQGISPMPSYVEILTCIEMYDNVGALNRRGEQTRPLGGAAPGRRAGRPARRRDDAKISATKAKRKSSNRKGRECMAFPPQSGFYP
ncbi:conserved hypothetical protein [Methylocella silvestris BL2]|uniref:Lysozyme inhibitor LprI N-terminal domain-containing protein n=1 Tax=Methylocella silvestris (strain DSM 15510 / CIP 108128 / LMG 27833 / NCIMB 13906 / BL2) TaxID=395965 RepID=B8EJD0_METSB|nr:hypothetical protein [Methylocella silvestris]ACK52622.1 conserved hypothetical protein [Methylocella silvestris BL2]